jgi:hypothetical protein
LINAEAHEGVDCTVCRSEDPKLAEDASVPDRIPVHLNQLMFEWARLLEKLSVRAPAMGRRLALINVDTALPKPEDAPPAEGTQEGSYAGWRFRLTPAEEASDVAAAPARPVLSITARPLTGLDGLDKLLAAVLGEEGSAIQAKVFRNFEVDDAIVDFASMKDAEVKMHVSLLLADIFEVVEGEIEEWEKGVEQKPDPSKTPAKTTSKKRKRK